LNVNIYNIGLGMNMHCTDYLFQTVYGLLYWHLCFQC